jgi:hypothetical protein
MRRDHADFDRRWRSVFGFLAARGEKRRGDEENGGLTQRH